MRKNPRTLLWLIIGLAIFAVFIVMPQIKINKNLSFDANYVLNRLKINKQLAFREGLDLQGGTTLILRANMKDISSSQKNSALDSARIVIEKRVNLFGVSEPIVQTSISNNNDYRLLVDLPGLTDINEIKNLVGTTAQLTFWEQIASSSAKSVKSSDLMLIGPNYYKKTNLTGADIKQTGVTFDPNTGKPEVQLQFTNEGTKKFADITKRLVGKGLAMLLDNQLLEYPPTVNEPILTGNAVISGGFTTDTANQLSTQLNAGVLPVSLSILSSSVVQPTLGLSSLEKSLFAGILGFLIIVIFMSILYGRLGIIASVALSLYALFVLAIFKLSSVTPYGITLTLSGIAGFILSIGMAVDANILIFERMKEEVRQGKSRETAIELGFSRAWTSIRDSNIATLITSSVLYALGTGTVKGFALVLALGVLVSMFSAIVVTRTFLRLVYK